MPWTYTFHRQAMLNRTIRILKPIASRTRFHGETIKMLWLKRSCYDLKRSQRFHAKTRPLQWLKTKCYDLTLPLVGKASRVFCCDFCRAWGFTSARWGCGRQHCSDKTPGSYPQALLGEGCRYVQVQFPVNYFFQDVAALTLSNISEYHTASSPLSRYLKAIETICNF